MGSRKVTKWIFVPLWQYLVSCLLLSQLAMQSNVMSVILTNTHNVLTHFIMKIRMKMAFSYKHPSLQTSLRLALTNIHCQMVKKYQGGAEKSIKTFVEMNVLFVPVAI